MINRNYKIIMKEKNVGILGLLSVLILIVAISIFGFLNAEFSFANDFVSKLGAKGEPNALWFNLFGFITVGILLFVFGLAYGNLLNDRLLSISIVAIRIRVFFYCNTNRYAII